VRAILRLLIVFLAATPSLADTAVASGPRPHSPELAMPVATAHVGGGERPVLRVPAAPGVLTSVTQAHGDTGTALIVATRVPRRTGTHRALRGRAPPRTSPV